MKNSVLAMILMGAVGFTLWGMVCELSGETEAWNRGSYYVVPIVLTAIAGTLGFAVGRRPLALGLSGTLGQVVGLYAWHPSGRMDLWPLVVGFFVVISVPSILAAKVGMMLRRRERNEQEG